MNDRGRMTFSMYIVDVSLSFPMEIIKWTQKYIEWLVEQSVTA